MTEHDERSSRKRPCIVGDPQAVLPSEFQDAGVDSKSRAQQRNVKKNNGHERSVDRIFRAKRRFF
ncbi:hypothetical protein CSB45_10005 [candidate division KSB3 bacterium]|uniref:Uncharacterized protein n=1 Tax=candidate division KSB3 bacterium TaxID=2044937 RepID=A0A2G6E3W6_9BACT|nr:MAG: hypothetical protein CSB45_10005 [candidate division KSB3 bacterium]